MGDGIKMFHSENLEAFPSDQVSELVLLSRLPELIDTAADWFALDVANGDAREDTIRTYMLHLVHWLDWCMANSLNPGAPSIHDIKN